MTDSSTSRLLDGIAVVGIAGRFPGSRDCDEFWQNLRAGREGLTFFTDEEIEAAGCDLGINRGKRVRSRGVVNEADYFDAAFFGYTPREADIMDPQQRVFLEVAWAALESAGFDPDRVPGAVGVYAGASINTYYPNNVVSRPDILGPFGVFPAVALNEKDFLATRVAYKLNLRGPAISVQTACSTSLVAVCNAAQSLLGYECDIALAGGVAINYPYCHSLIHEEGGMISADGHCKPFDKSATGTLFSDGAGVVALRRLEDAVESGDTILAVIKGYAINNDGSDKAGFTAPSINGQSEVIQMAQAFADIEPDTISYIEAHGTATPLGDPIEIAGLTQAFQTRTDATQFCALGSVKSNVGHLDVAAGIAGFIKTVLMLHHKEIPPTIHYTEPNAQIDFASTPFFVADKLQDWIPPEGIPRRAGISSFGIGGTNAHVILEEVPTLPPSGASRTHQLLPISARTKEAVAAASANLARHLGENDTPLADVAFTLQTGRYQFNQRAFAICADRGEAAEKLAGGDFPILVPARHNPPVVFMFPGQGSQRVNMGRDLYESERLYREIVNSCSEILKPELELDLRDVLFPAESKESWAEEQIVQTRVTQPALFVTEYALARLWMSWGVEPQSMIGHSVGEYVAACLAGVFSLEDGLKLIAARGRLIQEQPTGTMLAVMAGEEAVRPLLVSGVTIATINAEALCVVSGSHDDIKTMGTVLVDAKLEYRPLQTSHAFHSEMMEPVVAPFTKLLKGVQLTAPTRPFVSNLTGKWISDEEATSPDYWAQHMRQAVRFADGAEVLLGHHDQQVLLEVGPGATLTSLTRMNPAKQPGHVIVPTLASALPGQQPEMAIVLAAVGRLWQAGVDIDWSGFYADENRRRVPLPTYPFERKRFFLEPGQVEHMATSPARTGSPDPDTPATLEPAPAPASPRDAIQARLCECLQALSGLTTDELGSNASLMELGFDSLLLSRAANSIDVEFGVTIGLRQIAEEFPSISRLVDYIEAELPDDTDATDTGNTRLETSVADGPVADITLPMVDAQREIWLASQIDDDISRTYNESRILYINGTLRADLLRDSFQVVVDRHDALRTTFAEESYSQTILGHLQVNLAIESLADITDNIEQERKLHELVRASTTRLFDLSDGPMFRFSLYDLGNDNWAVLLVIHHLVADGWSWAVILDELGGIYSALANGDQPATHRNAQYADYAAWTGSPKHSARADSAERYWLELLADKPEELELPSDRQRPSRKTYESGRARVELDSAMVNNIRDAARRLDCTIFHLLATSFYGWLSRVTGSDDLVIAVPTAGQMAAGISELGRADQLVGHCVNMLPIRLNCDTKSPFNSFLQRTKSTLLDARDHQDVSFHNLINKLRWPRDPSRIPLASVSFNFGRIHQVEIEGLKTETDIPPKAFNFFDLTVDMFEGDDNLCIDCKFNIDLFDASTITRWLSQWQQMLIAGMDSPGTSICNLEILADAEREQLLVEMNSTERDFDRDTCLQHLIERQARNTPERTAVSCSGISRSYSELDDRANRFARALRDRGIGRDERVGVCVERSVDMLAIVLGVLKAGAAYVPLDPSFPDDRLRFMVDDAELAIIVSSESLIDCFELARDRQLLVDADAAVLDSLSGERLPADTSLDARPEDPAYLIYTSGSTGQPKGVVVPHRAVVNFLNSMAHKPGMTDKDVLVAVTTLSFDIAVLELYLPLILGARVVIASRDEAVDGYALKNLIEENDANILQATPVTWRLMLEAGWTGGTSFKALVGGEALPKDLADQLIANDVELWNMYGPTETTVWSTCARISSTADGITIGTPIDNTTVYILDEQKNLCPIGVPGELYIGGDGVTHGYWQRPELTADRFINDPYGDFVASKIYGTGDKARWLGDGSLEHLGRLDFQVKVRGFRIELGDIETHIVEHATVQEAVVVAREYGPGDQRLIAYYVARNAPTDLHDQLRQHLFGTLPEYMVPAHFVALDELPRTNNGKLDRKSLPDVIETATPRHRDIVDATTEVEKTLAAIWAEVLKLDHVGIDEDFFDLGGHSLLAMQVGTRIRQALSVLLPLRDFLATPTISEQAAFLESLLGQEDEHLTERLPELNLWASTAGPVGVRGERKEIVL